MLCTFADRQVLNADLREVGQHDDPVPVQRDGHDGEGGHVHRYAGEGLYHPEIIRDYHTFFLPQMH